MSENERIKAFFRTSYGDLYRGDEKYDDFYLKYMTDLISLVDSDPTAMAIMIDHRISAVATSPKGERMKNMIELLRKCKENSSIAWITVGEDYDSMKYACQMADYQRVNDQKAILALFETTIVNEPMDIVESDGGLLVHRRSTPSYTQELYC